jgi:hypothetical protein
MDKKCTPRNPATVVQHVPHGYDYKSVESKCGETSIYGETLQCGECSHRRPWYQCEHGVDLSECDAACWQCNAKYE